MRHGAECKLFAPVYHLNLQFPPTTRGRIKRGDDLPALHRVHLHPRGLSCVIHDADLNRSLRVDFFGQFTCDAQ